MAEVGSSDHRWKAEADLEILGSTVVVADAPGGSDLVFDLARDGGPSLYAGNPADRPRVLAGATQNAGLLLPAPDDALITAGDLLIPSILETGDDPDFGNKPDLRVFYRLV